VTPPSIVVGVLSLRGPGHLERLLGGILPQLRDGDSCAVALLDGVSDPESCLGRIEEARSRWRGRPGPAAPYLLGPGRLAGSMHMTRSEAANSLLTTSEQEVAALIDDRVDPSAGWLDAVRGCISDPGIDVVASRLSGAPSPENGRPGGRLRWTGHVQADYSASRVAGTTLAHVSAFAIRRSVAVGVDGFDEQYGAREWPLPFADVEFFTRIAKAGGRGRYCPRAVVEWLSPEDPYAPQYDRQRPPGDLSVGEVLLEEAVAETTAMAALFARHEAWALLIMGASHLASSLLEMVAGRLPRGAPARIAMAFTEGIRMGVAERQASRRAEGEVG